MRGDQKFYQTNERVEDLAGHFRGSKLYGSALAHMLKEAEETSGPLVDFTSGRLHDHLTRVLESVVDNMPNFQAIVCLGNESHGLVSSCVGGYTAARLRVGGCAEIELFKRRVLIGRLYHPSRVFKGGWAARHIEWRAVADQVNNRLAASG